MPLTTHRTGSQAVDDSRRSCLPCATGKRACDGARPCGRCAKLGKVDHCCDAPYGYKRLFKRLGKDVKAAAAAAESSFSAGGGGVGGEFEVEGETVDGNGSGSSGDGVVYAGYNGGDPGADAMHDGGGGGNYGGLHAVANHHLHTQGHEAISAAQGGSASTSTSPLLAAHGQPQLQPQQQQQPSRGRKRSASGTHVGADQSAGTAASASAGDGSGSGVHRPRQRSGSGSGSKGGGGGRSTPGLEASSAGAAAAAAASDAAPWQHPSQLPVPNGLQLLRAVSAPMSMSMSALKPTSASAATASLPNHQQSMHHQQQHFHPVPSMTSIGTSNNSITGGGDIGGNNTSYADGHHSHNHSHGYGQHQLQLQQHLQGAASQAHHDLTLVSPGGSGQLQHRSYQQAHLHSNSGGVRNTSNGARGATGNGGMADVSLLLPSPPSSSALFVLTPPSSSAATGTGVHHNSHYGYNSQHQQQERRDDELGHHQQQQYNSSYDGAGNGHRLTKQLRRSESAYAGGAGHHHSDQQQQYQHRHQPLNNLHTGLYHDDDTNGGDSDGGAVDHLTALTAGFVSGAPFDHVSAAGIQFTQRPGINTSVYTPPSKLAAGSANSSNRSGSNELNGTGMTSPSTFTSPSAVTLCTSTSTSGRTISPSINDHVYYRRHGDSSSNDDDEHGSGHGRSGSTTAIGFAGTAAPAICDSTTSPASNVSGGVASDDSDYDGVGQRKIGGQMGISGTAYNRGSQYPSAAHVSHLSSSAAADALQGAGIKRAINVSSSNNLLESTLAYPFSPLGNNSIGNRVNNNVSNHAMDLSFDAGMRPTNATAPLGAGAYTTTGSNSNYSYFSGLGLPPAVASLLGHVTSSGTPIGSISYSGGSSSGNMYRQHQEQQYGCSPPPGVAHSPAVTAHNINAASHGEPSRSQPHSHPHPRQPASALSPATPFDVAINPAAASSLLPVFTAALRPSHASVPATSSSAAAAGGATFSGGRGAGQQQLQGPINLSKATFARLFSSAGSARVCDGGIALPLGLRQQTIKLGHHQEQEQVGQEGENGGSGTIIYNTAAATTAASSAPTTADAYGQRESNSASSERGTAAHLDAEAAVLATINPAMHAFRTPEDYLRTLLLLAGHGTAARTAAVDGATTSPAGGFGVPSRSPSTSPSFIPDRVLDAYSQAALLSFPVPAVRITFTYSGNTGSIDGNSAAAAAPRRAILTLLANQPAVRLFNLTKSQLEEVVGRHVQQRQGSDGTGAGASDGDDGHCNSDGAGIDNNGPAGLLQPPSSASSSSVMVQVDVAHPWPHPHWSSTRQAHIDDAVSRTERSYSFTGRFGVTSSRGALNADTASPAASPAPSFAASSLASPSPAATQVRPTAKATTSASSTAVDADDAGDAASCGGNGGGVGDSSGTVASTSSPTDGASATSASAIPVLERIVTATEIGCLDYDATGRLRSVTLYYVDICSGGDDSVRSCASQ